jgi:hypothetical protein
MDAPEIDLRTASTEEVMRLMNRGVAEALREHARAGRTVVVWRDGRPVEVPAADPICEPASPPSPLVILPTTPATESTR